MTALGGEGSCDVGTDICGPLIDCKSGPIRGDVRSGKVRRTERLKETEGAWKGEMGGLILRNSRIAVMSSRDRWRARIARTEK